MLPRPRWLEPPPIQGSSPVSETDDVEDLVGEDAKLGIRKPLTRAARKPVGDTTHTVRSNISTDVAIPRAPFYGSRVVDDIDLDDVFAFANETALFKGQWQFKQGSRPVKNIRLSCEIRCVRYMRR